MVFNELPVLMDVLKYQHGILGLVTSRLLATRLLALVVILYCLRVDTCTKLDLKKMIFHEVVICVRLPQCSSPTAARWTGC